MSDDAREVTKSAEEWLTQLGKLRFEVLRNAATERPFTGEYVDTTADGVYRCGGCGAELFDSSAKFDAGCGWPSFWEAAVADNVETRVDTSHGMVRTEALCRRCGGHLGHLFDDGPPPSGQRWCINSASIDHTPRGGA